MYKLRYDVVMRQLEMYFINRRIEILEERVKEIDFLIFDDWYINISR